MNSSETRRPLWLFLERCAFFVVVLIINVQPYVLAVGASLYYFPMFKAAPTDVSIAVEGEVAEIYASPKSALHPSLFRRATDGRGFDAFSVEEGMITLVFFLLKWWGSRLFRRRGTRIVAALLGVIAPLFWLAAPLSLSDTPVI